MQVKVEFNYRITNMNNPTNYVVLLEDILILDLIRLLAGAFLIVIIQNKAPSVWYL